jgi:hypothetical protein
MSTDRVIAMRAVLTTLQDVLPTILPCTFSSRQSDDIAIFNLNNSPSVLRLTVSHASVGTLSVELVSNTTSGGSSLVISLFANMISQNITSVRLAIDGVVTDTAILLRLYGLQSTVTQSMVWSLADISSGSMAGSHWFAIPHNSQMFYGGLVQIPISFDGVNIIGGDSIVKAPSMIWLGTTQVGEIRNSIITSHLGRSFLTFVTVDDEPYIVASTRGAVTHGSSLLIKAR